MPSRHWSAENTRVTIWFAKELNKERKFSKNWKCLFNAGSL